VGSYEEIPAWLLVFADPLPHARTATPPLTRINFPAPTHISDGYLGKVVETDIC
jgi:hypothetical protein